MSQDFKKVLFTDSRLHLTDDPVFGVMKTAQQVTTNIYNALSESTSNHTYNIIVPSQNVVLDPYVRLETDMTIRITPNAPIAAGGDNTFQFQYGLSEALAPYPFQSACTTSSCTFNNTVVTQNSRDVMPVLLRACNKEANQKVNSGCPTYPDYFFNYEDAIGLVNNPLGGFDTATDDFLKKRGAHKIVSILCYTPAGARIAGDGFLYLRGSTLASGLGYIDVTFNVSEPLLISPFVFTDTARAGIIGINTIALNFNLGDCSRSYSVSRYYSDPSNPIGLTPRTAGYTYNFFKFENSRIYCNFLTPYPSQMLPARNSVNFYTLNRYLSASNNTALYAGAGGVTTAELSTNSLQLNSIPDKIFVYVRASEYDNYTPMSFLKIKKVNVQFNNQTGLLSTMNIRDLYRISVLNGIDQCFEEFDGAAMICKVPNGSNYATARDGPAVPVQVPLCGSILCLSLANDLSLSEEYLAPGVIGTYNLLINLSVELQQTDYFPLGQVADNGTLPARAGIPALGTAAKVFTPQVVLCIMNSGLFVTEQGTSSQYTAVLSAQDVISASKQQPASLPVSSNGCRLVGGSFMDDIKSFVSKVAPVVEKVANTISKGAKIAGEVAGAGASGGGMSGAAKHNSLKDRLRA